MDYPQSLQGPVRRKDFRANPEAIVGPLIWVALCFVVYLGLPRVEQFFEGFEVGMPIPAKIVLSYAWLALPLIAIVAGTILALIRTRLVSLFVLILLPLLLFAVLAVASGLPMLKLMDDLS